jgi:hypothetical protein
MPGSLLRGVTSGRRLRDRFWISYGRSLALQKEFGTWEYVTGMTGRSLAGKKGRSWARSCYERFEGFLCAGKLIS